MPWRTVRDAIGDIPPHPTEKNWHIGRNPKEISLARYKAIPPGGNRFDLPRELQPKCWIKKTKGGTDLMGRLWWDRPSVTIRTEFFKPEKGRYLHPEEHRPITHREAMRLQSFPDSFVFVGSKIEVAKQVGNAVPPPLAYAVALAVKKMLKKGNERTFSMKHSRPIKNPEELRRKLEKLIRNFKKELDLPELRTKVLALVPAYQILRDLGASLIPPSEAESAIDRIISYFRRYPGVVIDGDEIAVISGISEYARRVRELRVQFGWNIATGNTIAKMTEEEPELTEFFPPEYKKMKPDQYVLLSSEQDRDAALRWNLANKIRKMEIGHVTRY